MKMIIDSKKLDKNELIEYHKNGWIGPYNLVSKFEMDQFREIIDEKIINPSKNNYLNQKRFHNQHLENYFIWKLIKNENLVSKVASIIGPNLILWRSNFQLKPKLSEHKLWNNGWNTIVPWHQDCAYYQPSPNVVISAWIAIDEATKNNGCMRVISGSHKNLYPHDLTPNTDFFNQAVNPSLININNAIDIELKAGQFILFNESILHSSNPNRSNLRRLGFSPRITVPFVDVGGREKLKVILLNGKDYMGDYNCVSPPKNNDNIKIKNK